MRPRSSRSANVTRPVVQQPSDESGSGIWSMNRPHRSSVASGADGDASIMPTHCSEQPDLRFVEDRSLSSQKPELASAEDHSSERCRGPVGTVLLSAWHWVQRSAPAWSAHQPARKGGPVRLDRQREGRVSSRRNGGNGPAPRQGGGRLTSGRSVPGWRAAGEGVNGEMEWKMNLDQTNRCEPIPCPSKPNQRSSHPGSTPDQTAYV